jgi:hypothetical protein
VWPTPSLQPFAAFAGLTRSKLLYSNRDAQRQVRKILSGYTSSLLLILSEGSGEFGRQYEHCASSARRPTFGICHHRTSGVPRLLSFYAHPLDVLEFTLMELFQADWQRSRIGTRCLADLQKYPEFQRNRIVAVMRQYTDWLHADQRTTPLLSLQSAFSLPFDLYPQA